MVHNSALEKALGPKLFHLVRFFHSFKAIFLGWRKGKLPYGKVQNKVLCLDFSFAFYNQKLIVRLL